MIYINRRDRLGNDLTTVAEFPDHEAGEALRVCAEFRKNNLYKHYYLSRWPADNWKKDKENEDH